MCPVHCLVHLCIVISLIGLCVFCGGCLLLLLVCCYTSPNRRNTVRNHEAVRAIQYRAWLCSVSRTSRPHLLPFQPPPQTMYPRGKLNAPGDMRCPGYFKRTATNDVRMRVPIAPLDLASSRAALLPSMADGSRPWPVHVLCLAPLATTARRVGGILNTPALFFIIPQGLF